VESSERTVDRPPTIRSTTNRTGRIRSAMVEPAEDVRIERLPVWAGYLAGFALPLGAALVLIPFRDDLHQSAALIMIVPVIAVALLGGARPAVVAALAAGGSYAVLLTQPYGQLAIHHATDVVATITLLVVGLVVGVVAVREQRYATRAELRRDELERLVAFAERSASTDRADGLIDEATSHLRSLLQLERCDWRTGTHTGTHPLLLDDGQIMGYLHDLPADRSQLPPSGVELLAQTSDAEIGSFVLVPTAGTTTSVEQRRTAAAIANLLALALERGSPPGRVSPPAT
jgi:K+-sensing histidine kinase KdpD